MRVYICIYYDGPNVHLPLGGVYDNFDDALAEVNSLKGTYTDCLIVSKEVHTK